MLTVANLVSLGTLVCCLVSAIPRDSQISLLALDNRESRNPPTYGKTHLPTLIEPTLFPNSALKVAGLKLHATTPSMTFASYAYLTVWSSIPSHRLCMISL